MQEPYVGQVICVPYNFVPVGWAACNGELLPIAGNETLFSVIGTTYGGDGVTTFALPDLQCRVPLGAGTGGGINYAIGESLGVEVVMLDANQVPAHTHAVAAGAGPASTNSPVGAYLAPSAAGEPEFAPAGDGSFMASDMVRPTPAGNTPHNNMQPFLVLNWIIALEGLYPSPA